MIRSAFAVLLFTIAFPVIAADEPSGVAPLKDEILVTASSTAETVEETPAAATVITRNDIDSRAARDVADVLREVPGVSVSRSGSAGKATSLFTRGSNSTHTLVLWNGIEINNPYFAGYDWGRFSTAGVEQVEVVRGPFSALYGSDAVAGVVNILTDSRKNNFSLDVSAGQHGLFNGTASGNLAAGPWSFAGSVERRDDNGWQANDDFSQNAGNVSLRWSGPSFSAGILARATHYELGIPMNVDAAGSELVPSPNRRQEGREFQIAVPLQQKVGPVSFDLTLSRSDRRDDFADPDDPFGYTSARTTSDTDRAQLTAKMRTAAGLLLAGGEYEKATVDDVSSYGVSLDGEERTAKSLFVEDRYSRDFRAMRLEVSAGLRSDEFTTFGRETSPRGAAAVIFGSNKIRAGAGRAFRAPSIGELYFPYSGNTALDPERSVSYEIGYDRFLSRGMVSATAFRSSYDNLIVFDNGSYMFQNTGAAKVSGVELSGESELGASLSAGLSYTYLHTEQADTGEALLRRPKHSGSAHLGYRRGAWTSEAVVAHTGPRADVLPVFPYSRIEDRAFTTVDITLMRQLGAFVPYLKGENLTDERYEEIRGYRAPGRRLSLGLRYTVK